MVLYYLFISLFITILIHELGHAIAAMLCRIKIKIFSIGLGKPIWYKIIKNTKFQITPILVGGYVTLVGENDKTPDGFLVSPYRKKTIILFAGVLMNLLMALSCYLIVYKSIPFGLWLDWNLLKSALSKNYLPIIKVSELLNINIWITNFTLINLTCAIFNLIPFPPLDGSLLWLVWLEKIFKENFPVVLKKICRVGFIILMILQVGIIYYLWR